MEENVSIFIYYYVWELLCTCGSGSTTLLLLVNKNCPDLVQKIKNK